MYYFEKLLSNKSNHAGSKAVLDVERILKINGWVPVKENQGNKISRIASLIISLVRLKNTNILFQYPNDFKKIKVINLIKKNNVKTICLIHDLESLRYLSENSEKEISNLNKFDFLIVHNTNMKSWLIDNGCTSNMITLDLFDYLLEKNDHIENKRKTDISFAGNLDPKKCGFIYKLQDIQGVSFNLYGPFFKGESKESVKYKGQYSPEELIDKIEGKFGLIWDGSSLNSCEGITGNYTRYNNPHKLSMYIVSEIPVICWSQMAIANFVRENNIGLCVDDLNQLATILERLSDREYQTYLENIKELKSKIIKGHFLLSAIDKIKNFNE